MNIPKLGDSNMSGSLRSKTIETISNAAGHHRSAWWIAPGVVDIFVCSGLDIFLFPLIWIVGVCEGLA